MTPDSIKPPEIDPIVKLLHTLEKLENIPFDNKTFDITVENIITILTNVKWEYRENNGTLIDVKKALQNVFLVTSSMIKQIDKLQNTEQGVS